ncbi:MAG: hypothetical protein ACFFC7_08650 [Candidatus Hermodarchaeota archaeon]
MFMRKGIDQLQQMSQQIQQLQSDLDEWLSQAKQLEEQLKDQINQLNQEMSDIEAQITQFDTQIIELTEQQTNLENASKADLERAKSLLEDINKDHKNQKTDNQKLRDECDSLHLQIGEEQAAVGTAATRRETLAQQLAKMKDEFKKMRGLASQDISSIDVLRTYVALYNNVFATRPHVRALGLLHGPKAEWNKEEFAKTLAVSEIVIEECIEDLIRAELITWDEKGENVRLLARLF